MKTKNLVVNLLVLVLALVLSGCAGKSMGPADTGCTNNNINSMLKSGDYQKKIDSFLIIQDASSSMSERAAGTTASYESKLAQSKDLVRCLNDTLPDNFDVNAGLRGLGPFHSEKGLIYGMTGYTKAGLDSAILSIGGTGGITPMANSLINGSYDLLDKPGKKAVIIFSDGVNTDAASPAAAAASMKEMHGNNICIYTVLLGDDPKGKVVMEQIAAAGKCGFAIDGSAISSEETFYLGDAQGMDKFVTEVFLAKVIKKPAPVMKKPAPVMKKPVEKITMTLYFEFDFDKAVVRPEYHDDATKIADSMNKYPEANLLLEGHTDEIGTEEYNMTLSRRRANNVKMYLVEKFNVDASRISTVGYGKSNPIASNDTDAGRQRNRRVVANIE
ncbi:MAG: OmpA family protein [Desulfobacterales bacterium]|nr:OmpA family protein [Desulfobacterales bacterium]